MRHLRFRLARHVLLFPLEAAAFLEEGAPYLGHSMVRREGLLVPVRDLMAEIWGKHDGPRVAVHVRRADEQGILLVEHAETIVDVDDESWRPLPGALGPLVPWVDAVQAATTSESAPAYRLCLDSVWREFARIPEAS